MRKKLFVLVLLASFATYSSAELYPKMGTLSLKVTGITSEEGKIVVSVFDSKERWMKTDKAVLTKSFDAKGSSLNLDLKVPLGRRYAVSCYHDLNGNGKLDTGLPIPKPTEPVGTSVYTGNSIPRFYDCSFRFNSEPLEISVPLRKV